MNSLLRQFDPEERDRHCCPLHPGLWHRTGAFQRLDLSTGVFQRKQSQGGALHSLWELGLGGICKTGLLDGRNRYPQRQRHIGDAAGGANNDLAVILLRKNAEDEFIGDKIGWLRYGQTENYFVTSKLTGDLWTGALTTLGYPGKSDNGTIMQRCDGPSYVTKLDEVLQIYQGSDFTGGSSGGPWVANFGYQEPKFSQGAGPGEKSLSNVVVGVTSWGAGKPGPEYDNYSSQFGRNEEYPLGSYGAFGAGNIAALLNTLCSMKPEGSDQTYKELGYCERKK